MFIGVPTLTVCMLSFGTDVGRTAVAADKKQFQLSYQKEGGLLHNSKLELLGFMSANSSHVVSQARLSCAE